MKKVLVIGYCFPPTAGAEAFVTAKLLNNIPNCEIDVLTLADGIVSPVIDREMGAYATKKVRTIRKITPGPIVQRLVNMPRLPLRPDRWVLMTDQVTQEATRMIEETGYDFLITRSQYHSAHLAGYRLKTQFPDLSWIACFSDPWSDTSHQMNMPLFSYWSSRQEKKVLDRADRLVFPTEGMRDHMLSTCPGGHQRSVIIPHCYDENLFEQNQCEDLNANNFTMRLFGSFYHKRRPEPLIEGIAAARLPSGVQFTGEIYGGAHPAWKTMREKSNNRLSWKGSVPHRQALGLMRTSDLLVVVDAVDTDSSIFLPSKIVDYIGSGRQILSLCGRGKVADLTRAMGGIVVDGNDVPAISAAMEQAVEHRSAAGNPDLKNSFNARVVGKKFADMLL